MIKSKSIWWDTHRRGKFYAYEESIKYDDHPDVDGIIKARGHLVSDLDRVKIFQKHPLDLAKSLISKKYDPLVVVSCSEITTSELEHPSPGLFKDVFRRTNLIESTGKCKLDGMNALYCKASIFKDSNYKTTKSELLSLLCMCIPHVKCSKSNRTYEDVIEKSLIKSLVDMIFKISILHGYDCVIIPLQPGPLAFIDILVDALKRFPVAMVIINTYGVDIKYARHFTSEIRKKLSDS